MVHRHRYTSIAIILLCAFAISGCSNNEEDSTEDDQVEIVYEDLYQGDSIEEALLFMKVPDNRREATLQSIERYGPLANHNELKFANPATQIDILELARTEALEILNGDPKLSDAQHKEFKGIIQERYPNYLKMVEAG